VGSITVNQQREAEMTDTSISSKGFQDHHCHIGRAYTFHPEFFAHEGDINAFGDVPLKRKQSVTGVIHRGVAYQDEKSLRGRTVRVIEEKVAAGETLINAITDCTTDINSREFDLLLELREEYKEKININVGAYPLFGFKERDSDREKLIWKLAEKAQFLVGLPERDDQPDHPIGFDGHIATLIKMATKFEIPLQVHVDQTNTPGEDGTERLINAVHWLSTAALPPHERPEVWAVHVISPSAYPEERFARMVQGLQDNNIGVIVCPWAALSMRQMRNTASPTHNSMARVRELLKAGIRVRFGTDNINDLFMPGPMSALLMREWDALQSSERWYDNGVLAKLFRGEDLNQSDLVGIDRSLTGDYEAFGWLQMSLNHNNGH